MNSFKETTEFIKTLYPGQSMVPLHAPVFRGNEKKYLEECIDTTFVSSVGKFVDRFEEMTRQYTGAAKAVVCDNGTNALHMALLLSGVDIGDEVITQPITFIATANAISYSRAYPAFIDVDKDTLGLSPEKLDFFFKHFTTFDPSQKSIINKVTKRRISACVPMHTFGHPCRIGEIISVCDRYNIPVIEDAAESIGSMYKGKHTGTFGKLGIISYNGNKTITTGGGGMILTNDDELGSRAKHLTTQAKIPHRWEYAHDAIGYNYRMPNLNAALGCAQMEQLDGFIASKREIASKYEEFFRSFNDITFFTEPHDTVSNYWLNVVLLENKEEKEKFLEITNSNGVMTRPVWKLMNKLEMFKDSFSSDLANAEWLGDRIVNIPSSPR
jgi:perosamine synthetase